MHRLLGVFSACLLFAAAACQLVNTEVTRFNQMTPSSGETFVVVPTKEQEGHLEFAAYARNVIAEMSARGFQPVSNITEAKYAVMFAYAIDNGTTVTSQVPIYGQTSPGGMKTYSGTESGMVGMAPYSGSFFGNAYTAPTYGITGTMSVTDTVFTRALVLQIYDLSISTKDYLVPVFEAQARSAGSHGTLAVVMPAMIGAVFKDFPGKNGETITVNTPLRQ